MDPLAFGLVIFTLSRVKLLFVLAAYMSSPDSIAKLFLKMVFPPNSKFLNPTPYIAPP